MHVASWCYLPLTSALQSVVCLSYRPSLQSRRLYLGPGTNGDELLQWQLAERKGESHCYVFLCTPRADYFRVRGAEGFLDCVRGWVHELDALDEMSKKFATKSYSCFDMTFSFFTGLMMIKDREMVESGEQPRHQLI